ncbi:MAG: T9SS type A sorting domain-containing protein [Bacteroidota bacterium]|nr:T9SS type A sorting domain-containing protein [Bacteroidota bacterium]MDP4192399.1 T9SS type A sorting domain-containing protein [Bacteroidota bacterium]
MFKYLHSVFLLVLLLVAQTTTNNAQITITASDILNQNSPGTTHTLSSDTTTKQINIGSKGSSSWDFSNLVQNVTYTLTSVAPGTTPYDTAFPNANIVFHYNLNYMGVPAESWMYDRLDGDYYSLGIVSQGSQDSNHIVSKIKNTPPAISIKLPATMGTSWTQNYSEVMDILLNNFPFQQNTSRVITNYAVDGYGTAKMPDGKSISVLRIKSDQKTYTKSSYGPNENYSRMVSYMFYSNTGSFVSVIAADTTEPDNGVIKVSEVGWAQYSAPTAVDNETTAPVSFSLQQNYPNPFNPSTLISYSIAEDSFVELKIYDSIGKEVYTLVNQSQKKGEYSLRFNAGSLPSGIYLARIKAGSFTKAVKMLLLK